MKKILKVSAIIALMTTTFFCSAQDYNTGIGFRWGGLTSGLTVKHFTGSSTAIEGIAGFAYNSFLITGLYEVHKDISNAEGLKWLYGGGAHVGFFRYGGHYYIYNVRGNKYYVEKAGSNASVFGADFIIGLDYKFNNAPLNLGLDLKPFIDFFDGVSGYMDGALSFRFVF